MVQRRPRRFTSLYTLQSTVATKAVRYIIHVWIHTVHNFGFRSVQRYKFCTVRYGPVNRMYWSWYCTVQVARPSRRRRGWACSTRTADGACIILYRRRRCASFPPPLHVPTRAAPDANTHLSAGRDDRTHALILFASGQERRCTASAARRSVAAHLPIYLDQGEVLAEADHPLRPRAGANRGQVRRAGQRTQALEAKARGGGGARGGTAAAVVRGLEEGGAAGAPFARGEDRRGSSLCT